jgi:uncharacterized membrane protein
MVESMVATLTTVACFAGVFAIAFGVAGVIGLMDLDPPKTRPGTLLAFIDLVFTGGVLAICQDMLRNWSSRPSERRLLLAGIGCGCLCVAIVVLIG